jgi:hypothetical protein
MRNIITKNSALLLKRIHEHYCKSNILADIAETPHHYKLNPKQAEGKAKYLLKPTHTKKFT